MYRYSLWEIASFSRVLIPILSFALLSLVRRSRLMARFSLKITQASPYHDWPLPRLQPRATHKIGCRRCRSIQLIQCDCVVDCTVSSWCCDVLVVARGSGDEKLL
ncbi:hypothetical protein GQ53DRAFT_465020 [Thozetella sp. PMI_491]|nr:hypothetical protein GQ53DRAFT_465020 [Thozetella sp. PMI_491]